MRFADILFRFIGCSSLLAFVAGCSGAGSSSATTPLSPAAPQALAGTRAPDAATSLSGIDAAGGGPIIVTDAGNKAVDVYNAHGKLTASIADKYAPFGVALDSAGNVYFADGFEEVLVYKSDYKTLIATLTDSGKHPYSVAVDQATGVVGLTSQGYGSNPGSLSFYAPGKTTQCKTLALPIGVFYGAFDATGNFYISGIAGNKPMIGVVENRCSATTITPLRTANTLASPSDLQITPAGKIAISDLKTKAIYTYNAPVNDSLGKPVATTALKGSTGNYTSYHGFAFTADGASLWLADGATGTLKYAYPAGGAAVATIKTNIAQDVALKPAAQQ